MLAAVIGQLSAYAVRIILIQAHGLEGAGYYQAAFAIAGSLPGFVFTAMGTDFFPRIASVKTEAEAQELCEKQIQAGLLLALPLIAGLLTLGQECIHLLYAQGFEQATPLLSWMVWGVFLRLLSWPMGYWLLARGSSRAVVIVESIASIISVLLPLALVPEFGIVGAAMGFFVSYVAYTAIMLVVSRKRSGRWIRPSTLGWFILSASIIGISKLAITVLDGPYWGLIPTCIIAVSCCSIYFHNLRKEKV
jgi:PST family polysaccharide transporter